MVAYRRAIAGNDMRRDEEEGDRKMVGLEVCLSCGAEPHMLNDGRPALLRPALGCQMTSIQSPLSIPKSTNV